MLDQTLESLKSCKDLATARLEELIGLRGENALFVKEKILLEKQIGLYEKRIEYLEKIKCSTINFFFVIKWKRCG